MAKTFMGACIEFFGLKNGQTKIDFGREVLALNDGDKQEIYEGFRKLGIDCDPPLKKAA